MPDSTCRGAGICGLSRAWICTVDGARVQVIAPHGPGAGASGGLVGALAPHVPENWNAKKAFQFESLISADAFWAHVEETGGMSAGYGRTGRLQPVADEPALALAQARSDTARTLWQGRAVWHIVAAQDIGPWAPNTPTGFLIYDTLSARMHPRRACAALVAALNAKSVPILERGEDRGPVIWCTGLAGLDALNAEHTRQVGNGVKGQAALLALPHPPPPDAPQLFADALHVIPHADGRVAVGSTSEREFDDGQSTDAQLDAVIARARSAVPALQEARVLERWAGVRPRARSRAPMLGEWPGRAGHYIANGGFKIGFGMAPKVAEVMANLVLEGVDAIPDDFRVKASL